MSYTSDVLLNKEGDSGTQVFNCSVGDELLIWHPGFSKGAEMQASVGTKALRGFRLIYPLLGDLIAGDRWNEVKYHHRKGGTQVIEYIDRFTYHKSYLVMQTIAVHDHSTIPTGGPAFATYYSEERKEES